jgi:N-acetylglucosaminyldiphosphoundecaprenol N-acetyl-beta-D-mannosaminyltransferase
MCFYFSWLKTGKIFDEVILVGRFRQPLKKLSFRGEGFGKELAILFNILRGDMAFVGPRPLSEKEVAEITMEHAERFDIRPGWLSPYMLRRKVGINYDKESHVDKDFFYSETLAGDCGILVRSVINIFLGGNNQKNPIPPILNFFDIPIVNTTMSEAIDWIIDRAKNNIKSHIAFVNPDCLNISYIHHTYKKILISAERVLPDGIGIHVGCRMLGVSLKANINGTDLFPRLCEKIAERNVSLFLLGARPGIAEQVANKMQQLHPGLCIAGTHHGYFDQASEKNVIRNINSSKAEILLVAFGAPKQELWLAEHREQITAPILIGVGGLFDFYSDRIPRAPQWIREIGMEWVWRLLQEPGRMWRRYIIGNPLFLYRVWRQYRNDKSKN